MPTRDLTARREEALADEREARIGTLNFVEPCLEQANQYLTLNHIRLRL